MLKIKKIYVDSRWKTADSKSHTDFYYDLGNTYDLPENTSFYIDDINIPNSWYSIEENVNNNMYLAWKEPVTNIDKFSIISLPSNIYDGDEFIKALNIVLDSQTVSTVGGATVKHFTAAFNSLKNVFTISSTNCAYFQILSDDELKVSTKAWVGPSATFQNDNLRSLNEVIKQYGDTIACSLNKAYVSGYLDFSHYNNIYMTSNIGNYQTLSPSKGLTTIRKIPVNVPSGSVINDRQISQYDLLDCSRQCLSMLNFRFHDAYGRTINLNGCHVSFSIVFSNRKDDM